MEWPQFSVWNQRPEGKQRLMLLNEVELRRINGEQVDTYFHRWVYYQGIFDALSIIPTGLLRCPDRTAMDIWYTFVWIFLGLRWTKNPCLTHLETRATARQASDVETEENKTPMH
jgi:hypothetical protein